MPLFFAIVFLVLGSEILFWIWADRRLRPTRRARLWRTLLHTYMSFQFVGFLSIFVQRALGIVADLPATLLATIYLWHILILPATAVTLAIGCAIAFLGRRRAVPRPEPTIELPATSHVPHPTRRQILLAGATAVPPLLTGVSVATAMMQLGDFRVREFTIPLRDLPPDLDGMTIAHVSDTHVGRFTNGQKLKNIAEVTNSLRADLVLLTGDLIDYTLSDLPAAIDMVNRMDPRSGLYICQGNHDLFQSREAFDARVRAAGLALLVNDSARTLVRGRPVQLLGLRWAGHDDHLPHDLGKDAGVYTYVPRLAAMRDPDAFPILLAHHPHAFDPAAAAGLPLTLAGHTHGGQLMLTDHIGPGPAFYRYWSGLYRKRNAHCIVSNGVGNWFPLRVNAPAEIIHVTLRRADTT